MICQTCKNSDIKPQDNYCKICGTKIDKETTEFFKTIETDKGQKVGHVCKCGKEHRWPSYVFAHYHELLTHKCECGVKVRLCNGMVEEESKKLVDNCGGCKSKLTCLMRDENKRNSYKEE